MSSKRTGDKGEVIAIKYLKQNGYTIKETNFKFGRFGEVDIVASIGNTTCFIEVKYRNNTYFGLPEESIVENKLKKCKKTVEYYSVLNNICFENIRFDVVTILKEESSYKITHYRNLEI